MRPRSTFGAAETTPTTQTTDNSSNTGEAKKPTRLELGAIWENSSKTSGQSFLKVQLKIPKEMLQEALNNANGDVVDFGFISFSNKYQNGDPARPKYRIYEDKKR